MSLSWLKTSDVLPLHFEKKKSPFFPVVCKTWYNLAIVPLFHYVLANHSGFFISLNPEVFPAWDMLLLYMLFWLVGMLFFLLFAWLVHSYPSEFSLKVTTERPFSTTVFQSSQVKRWSGKIITHIKLTLSHLQIKMMTNQYIEKRYIKKWVESHDMGIRW